MKVICQRYLYCRFTQELPQYNNHKIDYNWPFYGYYIVVTPAWNHNMVIANKLLL